MKSDRPVFLDLTKVKFPITAIISILHRVAGVVLFLFIPFLLYLLHRSTISMESFTALSMGMQSIWVRLAMWIVLSAVIFHLLAGIRHLMMDMGLAEHLKSARITAATVIVLSAILIIWAGIWIW